MKNLSTILATVAFLVLTLNVSAGTIKKEDKETLSTQVVSKLKENQFSVWHDVEARVYFTVNESKEIEVLKVNTENQFLAEEIASQLNYQLVDVEQTQIGKTYAINFSIKL